MKEPQNDAIRRKPTPLTCDICREEVYSGELFHYVDGKIICPACFFDFAFDYFSDRLMTASELRRNKL